MGLKTIDALRKELSAKAATLEKFERAAAEFSKEYAKIQQAYDSVDRLRRDKLAAVEQLDTMGMKEFDVFKQGLVGVYKGFGNRLLPIEPLRAVVDAQRKAVNEAVQAHVAKLAATFPKEVKKGMVFRHEASLKLHELVGDAQISKNPNFKTDEERTFFDSVNETGGKYPLSVADLRKNFKFIKT